MAIQNLDQIAWDYLMGSPRDQATLGKVLVNAGTAAVFPLLRAGLRVAREFNPLQTKGVKPLDRQLAELTWIYRIAKPMLESIHTIVSDIGQPAYDALCRALWEKDEQIKVFAAIVLLQEPYPTSRTTKQVEEAFYQITSNDHNKRYFIQSGIFMALSHILARGGSNRHQQVLQKLADDNEMSEEEFIELVRNTLLLYLIR